jgi:hypothetical protein
MDQAILSEEQVPSEVEISNVTIDQDPPSKKLWSILSSKEAGELYTNSYSDFVKKYSTPEAIQSLHATLSSPEAGELYTNDLTSFEDKYFPELKKKGGTPPSNGGSAGASNVTIPTTDNTQITQVPLDKEGIAPVITGEPEPTDAISRVLKSVNLGKATRKQEVEVEDPMLGTTKTLIDVPDEQSAAESKKITEELKAQNINADDLYEKIKDLPEDIYNIKVQKDNGEVYNKYSKENLSKMYQESPVSFDYAVNNLKNRFALKKAASDMSAKGEEVNPIELSNKYNDLNQATSWDQWKNNKVEQQKLINTYLPNMDDRKAALKRLEDNSSMYLNPNNEFLQQEYATSPLKDKLDLAQYSALTNMQLFHPEKYESTIKMLTATPEKNYEVTGGLKWTGDGFEMQQPEETQTQESVDQKIGKQSILQDLSSQGRYSAIIGLQDANEKLAQKIKELPKDQSSDMVNQYNDNTKQIESYTKQAEKFKQQIGESLGKYKDENIQLYNQSVAAINDLSNKNNDISNQLKQQQGSPSAKLIDQYNTNIAKIQAIKADFKNDDQKYPELADLKYDTQVKDLMQQAGFNAAEYGVSRFGKGINTTGNTLENVIVSMFGSDADKTAHALAKKGEQQREASEFYLPSKLQGINKMVDIRADAPLQAKLNAVVKGRDLKDLSADEVDQMKNILAKNQSQIQTVTPTDAGKSKNFLSLATLYSNTGMLGDIASFAVQGGALGALGASDVVASTLPMWTTTQDEKYKEGLAQGMSDSEANGYANLNASIMALAGLVSPKLDVVKRAIGLETKAGQMLAGVSEKTWNAVIEKNKPLIDRLANSVTHTAKEAANMGLTYGVGTSVASDVANKAFYNKDITGGQIVDNAVTGLKNILTSSAALLGVGAISNFKSTPLVEKAGLWDLGNNPDLNIKRIDEAVANNQITAKQAEQRKAIVNQVSSIIEKMPTTDKNGKPLTDIQRLNTFYNLLLQEKIKDQSTILPKAQKKELEYTDMVLDHANNLVIDPKTPDELATRKAELEAMLEPQVQADGSEVILTEADENNIKAEIEAIDDYNKKYNQTRETKTSEELLSGQPAVQGVEQIEVVRQMKPITDKMVEIEREFGNNGFQIDTDYDNEIQILDKDGEQVGPEDLPDNLRQLAADYEMATRKLGEFDDKSREQALKESRGVVETEAEVVEPGKKELTNKTEIEKLRAEEQAELDSKILNAEQYRVDGKVDRSKLTNEEDIKAFDEVYDKYDKLITPLLEKPEGEITPMEVEGEQPPFVEGGIEVVTHSGLTEPQRQKLIEQRNKELKVTERTKEQQSIIEDIEKYNALPNGRLGKQKPEGLRLLNNIRLRINNFNEKYGADNSFNEKRGVLLGDNKRAVKKFSTENRDQEIDTNGTTIRDRNQKTQEVFDTFLENGSMPTGYTGNGMRMSDAQLDATIQDILDGVPSRRANKYLNDLEAMIREDDFDFTRSDSAPRHMQPQITFEDVVGTQKETVTEPMTQEDVDRWLNEEADRTPENEEVYDNIDNLISQYETENESKGKIPTAETGTTTEGEGEAGKAESTTAEQKPTGTEAGTESKIENTTEALKEFDAPIKKGSSKTKGTELYHKAIDLIGNTIDFNHRGWGAVSEAYHKALDIKEEERTPQQKELISLINDALGTKEVKETKFTETKVTPTIKVGETINFKDSSGNKISGEKVEIPGYESLDLVLVRDGFNNRIYELSTGIELMGSTSFSKEEALKEASDKLLEKGISAQKIHDRILAAEQDKTTSKLKVVNPSPAYEAYKAQKQAEYEKKPFVQSESDRAEMNKMADEIEPINKNVAETLRDNANRRKVEGGRSLSFSLEDAKRMVDFAKNKAEIEILKSENKPLPEGSRKKRGTSEEELKKSLNEGYVKDRFDSIPDDLKQPIVDAWRKQNEIYNKYGYTPESLQGLDGITLAVGKYLAAINSRDVSKREGRANFEIDNIKSEISRIDDAYKKEIEEAKPTEITADQKTKLEAAKEAAAFAKARLDAIRRNLGIIRDTQKEAQALYDYHKALVKVAKEYISAGIDKIEDFAKEIGEKVNAALKTAWDEATGKIEPLTSPSEIKYKAKDLGEPEEAITDHPYLYRGSKEKRVSGLMSHIQDSENVSEATKQGFKDAGVKYEVANNAEARKVAGDIIKAFGPEDALQIARGTDMHPSVRSAIYGESINNAFEREQKATTDAERIAAAEEWKDLVNEYDEKLTEGGQFTAYSGHFYKTSPLGFVMREKEANDARFNEWYDSKAKTYDELWNELTGSEEGRAKINEELEKIRKEERKQERSKRDKNIEDFFDSAKMKGGTYLTIIPPMVWNGAMDVLKLAVKGGDRVVDAVQKAIDHISDKIGDSWDKEKFRKEYEEKLNSVTGTSEKREANYEGILNRRRAELERRIKEGDYSAEEYKDKRTLTEKEQAAKEEYDRVKKLYDEAKKDSKEYQEKKAKQFLDKFADRMKGLSDEQKQEVVRRSIKKLVETGGLEKDEFKKIIADVIGLKDLTSEQVKKIEDLTATINAVEGAEDRMVADPTPANIAAYEKAKQDGLQASLDLFNMVHRKSDIIGTIKSLITGSLLSVPTLVKNVMQNVIMQSQIRFPKSIIKQVIDLGTYGASVIGNKLGLSKVYEPTTNIIDAQKGYFGKGKKGIAQGWFNFKRGTEEKDYFGKTSYRSSLAPKEALKDLKLWKKGEKFLTTSEVIDRKIRASIFSRQADFILRGMGFGDRPQRWAAEGSTAIQIAKNELKLTDMNEMDAFMLSPQKYAYKVFTKEGMPHAEAIEKSNEIQKRIEDEGSKAVLEEENVLSKISKHIDTGLQTKKEDLLTTKALKTTGAITKTLTFPFVKIPANVYWQMFKLMNPEISLGQSVLQGIQAAKFAKEGDNAKAKEYYEKSKDSAAMAMLGYGIGIAATTLVSQGYVRSSNEQDQKKRETEGERVFGKQNEFNLGRLMGGGDYWVNLDWFGPVGAMLNTKSRIQDTRKQAELAGKPEDLKWYSDLVDNFSESSVQALNQLVFDQGARTIDAMKNGQGAVKLWTLNTMNTLSNVITGGTYAAMSKAMLPVEPRLRGDKFTEELLNNQKQRNVLLRLFAGQPPSRVSIWGDPIKKDNSITGVMGNMLGFEKNSKDQFGSIIYGDFVRTQDPKFFPVMEDTKITVDNKPVEISQKERDDLNTFIGQARKNLVAPFVYDLAKLQEDKTTYPTIDLEKGIIEKKYSDLDDENKVKALNVIYEQGRELGYKHFIEKYPKYAAAQMTEEKAIKEAINKKEKEVFKKRLEVKQMTEENK